ncbi:MAG: hypothetical protein P8016_17220 [Sedimentisphaerales bacterium]
MAAKQANVEVELYDIDETFYPKELPVEIPRDCAVVYVNYFGLCHDNILRLLSKIPGDSLIIDNSQALFDQPTAVLASIYSPRKFVGLPDGGLLMASPGLNISPPVEEDQGSFDRMRYLLVRMAYSARAGYAAFNKARNSLSDLPPLAMSKLTRRLMRSIRWNEVAKRRRENYKTMAAILDAENNLQWSLGKKDVPLCYPFMSKNCEAKSIKDELAERNIFSAVYWPDVFPRLKAGTIEAALLNHTLFLPIDQRMNQMQVKEVCKAVLEMTQVVR